MSDSRGTLFLLVLTIFVGLTALTLSNCGGDDGAPPDNPVIVGPQPDSIPPSTVANLHTDAHTYQSMALVWSAPGDDRTEGTAARYDIRYSLERIFEDNWDSATPIDSNLVPTPSPSGAIETIVILWLDSNTEYFFALKASDEEGNESSLSNCCSGKTDAEEFEPAAVTDLYAEAVTETSFELTWTATGDDFHSGQASRYEIRYSNRPIETEGEWNAATPVANPPTPKSSGEKETFIAEVDFNQNYYFALKVADEMDNWSELSNMAPGLKLGEIFWVWPASVATGETMYVVFKGAATGVTRVSLQETFWWWEDVTCGDRVITDLFWNSLEGRVHMVRFDFWDEQNQEYYPVDSYYMSLCYGPYMQVYKYISVY
jgi:hypothetical protein